MSLPRSLARFSLHAVAHTALLLAASASMAATLADVQLVDRTSGERLKVYQHQGEYWVAGRPGASYSIDIKNRTSGRILAVISVDGVNAITGKTASATPDDGYVFSPWQNWSITGWRKSDSQVAAFYFSESGASYATRTGRPRDVGVIGVALFRERQPEPVRQAPPIARRSPEMDEYADARASKSTADSAAQAPMPQPSPTPQASPAARAELPASAGPASDLAAEAEPAPKSSAIQGNANHDAKRAPSPHSQPAAPSRPSLGTGHGALESSHTRTVDFDSATARPVQIVRIRYDSHENLVAKGVIREPRTLPGHSPNPFPIGGYVPDPPRW